MARAEGVSVPPRLLLLSDVSAERTTSGALVLYRLLRSYPADRLCVVSRPRGRWNLAAERLPGVRYHDFSYNFPRRFQHRFNPFWQAAGAWMVTRHVPRIRELVSDFRPQAILSVAEGFLWLTAARAAKAWGVPLHLILHDDWPHGVTRPYLCHPRLQPVTRRLCEAVYKRGLAAAATRLAVSPGMAEECEAKYGVPSDVLYPSRGEDSADALVRVRQERSGPPVVAYAGVVYHRWAAAALRSLADVLGPIGGRLDLYVPHDEASMNAYGLGLPHCRLVGFFPAAEMARRVAATADLLFLPASFEPQDRIDCTTLFPSKLADYTAVGLPVLVWGPEYSSAVRWARENPGAAELVTDRDPGTLESAVMRLIDPNYATKVAAAGVVAGYRDFSPEAVRQKLMAVITRNGSVAA